MNVTRKQFLSTVAAGTAAAALRPASLLAATAGGARSREFQSLVGKSFRLHRADDRDTVDLVLDEFVEVTSARGTKQFSLRFVAGGGQSLREGTYTMEQEAMGSFPIFLTPTRRDAQGRTWYRADFNLLEPAAGQQDGPVRRA